MANKGQENLIPFSERSKEEARESGAKGGRASGRKRRQNADMRKLMKMMLKEDAPRTELSHAQKLTLSMLTIAGDPSQGAAAVNAYKTILHIIGQDEPITDGDSLKAVKALLRGIDSVIDNEAN